MEYLRVLLRRRFARAEVATSWNIGCFLRLSFPEVMHSFYWHDFVTHHLYENTSVDAHSKTCCHKKLACVKALWRGNSLRKKIAREENVLASVTDYFCVIYPTTEPAHRLSKNHFKGKPHSWQLPITSRMSMFFLLKVPSICPEVSHTMIQRQIFFPSCLIIT